jgi:hypothetical protein
MEVSLDEKIAYVNGYSAVNELNLKTNKFLPNPYNEFKEPLLWEAWEVGFNDAFEDVMETENETEE